MYSVPPKIYAPHIAVGTSAYRATTLSPPINRSEKKRDLHTRHRAWILDVADAKNISVSAIATGAGLTDTTLTRVVSDPTHSRTLSAETIDLVKQAHKVPGPEEYEGARHRVVGFAEAERFDTKREDADIGRRIAQMLAAHPSAVPWRLKTSALEQAGYLPGDIVVVDHNLAVEPQDAVCAHITDYQHGAGATIWRIYDPPYLIAAANDRLAYKPLLVDNDRITIRGVIIESLRPHRLSRAR